MHRSWVGCSGVLVASALIGSASPASAATTALGDAIANTPGSSNFLVNAGDAIQQTCGPLAAAGGIDGTLPGHQQDLFYRCNEMIGTYVSTVPNSYGYAQGSAGDSNRLNAVRQFSGEEASSQGRFATDSSNRQFANLGNRLSAIRQGFRRSMGGLAFNLNDPNADPQTISRSSIAPIVGGGASADESDADLGWAWFGNVGGGWGDRNRTQNEDGYDFDSYVFTLGADYAFANSVVLGMAFGYNEYHVDFNGNYGTTADPATPVTGGDIDSDGYTVAAYGTYSSDRFFANGIVTYGWNSYDMTRRIQLLPGPVPVGRPAQPGFQVDRRLTSDTNSDQWAGQASGGMSFGTGATTADLYVGIDYLKVNIDSFTESEQDLSANPTPTPGLALHFDSQGIDSTQSVLGFSVRQAWNTHIGVILPYIGGEWRHEFQNDSHTVNYRYQYGIAQPSFATPTDKVDEDFFVASGGISAQFANNLFAYLEYDATLGLEHISANFVTLGIRGTF